jgi:DNA-binding protein HU-beta
MPQEINPLEHRLRCQRRGHEWLAKRVREHMRDREKLDVQQTVCRALVDAMVDAMKLAVEAGDRVTLMHFGSFQLQARAARIGRDPRNATPLPIAPTMRCSFKQQTAWGDYLTQKFYGYVDKPLLSKLAKERWMARRRQELVGA